ncbi:hypothetical protein PINS_up002564 [Pythium insidiosum]|nr:hypothetical protein PINS_up002564 [Pythium insidiosum]
MEAATEDKETAAEAPNKRQKKEKKPKREFQMSKYAQRLVAIKFLYIGDKYDGFARQDHTEVPTMWRERKVLSCLTCFMYMSAGDHRALRL